MRDKYSPLKICILLEIVVLAVVIGLGFAFGSALTTVNYIRDCLASL